MLALAQHDLELKPVVEDPTSSLHAESDGTKLSDSSGHVISAKDDDTILIKDVSCRDDEAKEILLTSYLEEKRDATAKDAHFALQNEETQADRQNLSSTHVSALVAQIQKEFSSLTTNTTVSSTEISQSSYEISVISEIKVRKFVPLSLNNLGRKTRR